MYGDALMDPGTSSDLIAAVATLGGVGAAGALAVLAARRARASRLRQIDESDGPRPAVAAQRTKAVPGRVGAGAEDDSEEGSKEDSQAGPEREQPGAEAAPAPGGAAAVAGAERPNAQILPFPKPTPAPVAEPASEPPVPAVAKPPRDGKALVPGLAKTRAGWIARLGQIFSGRKEIDPALVDEIEKVLLTADIGVRTSAKLLEELRASLSRKELANADAIWAFLRRRCREILSLQAPPLDIGAAKPFVILIIGVNGSGKTTTIGKLASQFKTEKRSVLLAAGDTFRAAATEQLEVWGGRSDVPVVRGKEGADPSSVIFEGIKRASSEGIDVVIADTAGRLHTKTDLMEELQKVRRVTGKAREGAPHETWLVIDATSGQNAIAQAQIFTQAMKVTGIVLTKLDGTAKGGVILGIADQLGIPVRYVGVGERVEDLRAFDPDEFVQALFDGDNAQASAAS
jgi:fused signal recognition particle receptor